MRRFLPLLLLFAAALLVAPALALADAPQPGLALSPDQVWTAIAGAIVPLVGYVINHYAPWVSEEIKGLVMLLLAAATGAVSKLIATGGLDFAHAATWEYIGTAVFFAFAAHAGVYTRTNWSTRLGGGSNHAPRLSPPVATSA